MTRGPLAWRNALACTAGKPATERIEAILYGDAEVSGEIVGVLGPYDLLNPAGFNRPVPRPMLVVRASFHSTGAEDGGIQDPTLLKTDYSTFHGGGVFDELAALLSLALGIRCRSGGSTRHWFLGDDLDGFGRPSEYDHRPPSLSLPIRGSVLPAVSRSVKAEEAVEVIQKYFSLDPPAAVSVARASRMYQQAVWIADEDPNQAWLWLVGAVEVAAVHWHGGSGTPAEVLRASWPELSALLETKGAAHHDEAAKLLAPRIKATKRFIDFVLYYLPPPPEHRTYDWACADWESMGQSLQKVYDYRSQALHAGTPFPLPMCESPRKHDDGGWTERPDGLATSALDGRWTADDTPMLLWLFEYLARSALLSWWHGLG